MGPSSIAAAKGLVELLEDTAPLSEGHVRRLYEAHQKLRRIDFMAPGHVQQEQLGRLEALFREEASSELSLLWNRSRSTDNANDLVLHSKVVVAFFNKYIVPGEAPPPGSAWRVTVILRKEKQLEIDRSFLQGWCKHFGSSRGIGYERLARRLQQ